MKRLTKAVLVLLVASVLSSGVAQAALFDRGGGLIYDDVLSITWLQDANYAKTSGYDTDGLMNWSEANTWAAGLSYYDSVHNVTWTDWRLPTVNPVGDSFNFNFSNNGATDVGYGNTSINSELSYMYYVNLGNLGFCTPDNGNTTSCNAQPGYGLANTAPFDNLQSFGYWYGTSSAPSPTNTAWSFATIFGSQGNSSHGIGFSAWAVRPGDVAAVPEPETYALLLTGLGLIGFAAHRKTKPGILNDRVE